MPFLLSRRLALASAASLCLTRGAVAATPPASDDLRSMVDSIIKPLMAAQGVPGMAVAVSAGGQTRVYNYGLASRESRQPVDGRTLFEIGSISKVFTGAFGVWALAQGGASVSDPAGRYLPELVDTSLGSVSLVSLATYAAGLPLELPETVVSHDDAAALFQRWIPAFRPDTHRLYSNPSIGLFGKAAATAMGGIFEPLMTDRFLPLLGLDRTFLSVPAYWMPHYAQGYSRDDRPVRLTPALYSDAAYGLRTTAADLIRFVNLTMQPERLDAHVRDAVIAGRTGRFWFAGETLQGLGWEIYDPGLSLETLQAGNGSDRALEPQPIAGINTTPVTPSAGLLNKTGSTNGFGSYVALVPDQRIGVALLANRPYPNGERVRAAWTILESLSSELA